MKLRNYQEKLQQDTLGLWQTCQNVAVVLPTGGGKTVVFSSIISQLPSPVLVVAHRQEILSQISLSLAKNGVHHQIITSEDTLKWIIKIHVQELGQHYYSRNSSIYLAGVDTLIRNPEPWHRHIQYWVLDECHHLLKKNKWGRAISMLPANAKGLGFTATLCRTDGQGLGRLSDGFFDEYIEGPSPAQLIAEGYLCDYRIALPPSNFNRKSIKLSAGGDFSQSQLSYATKHSSIMGDLVTHYRKFADGKLGVTFAPSIELAMEFAKRFNAVGVPAEVVTGKTPGYIRHEILKRFSRREILQLVNVDLFDEGFDLPAIEVVQSARATQSYGKYRQQIGRALRPMPNKPYAMIIDHVGNAYQHLLPDSPKEWSLDRRDLRKKQQSEVPIKVCAECLMAYSAVLAKCPYCNKKPDPLSRSDPKIVEGELEELHPDILAQLRMDVARNNRSPDSIFHSMQQMGHSYITAKGAANAHQKTIESQAILREVIRYWGGSDREFYFAFGVDLLTAQTLKHKDTETLITRILHERARLAKLSTY